MSQEKNPSLTVMLVPEGGRNTRSYQISQGRLRLLLGVGLVLAVLVTAMIGSWWYLAARAARVGELEAEVRELRTERRQLGEIARQLEQLEARYDRLRSLFGDSEGSPSDLWLPPSGTSSGESSDESASPEGLPTSWPLTDRGFVTQTLLEGEVEHPGIDIAIPTDSYIRAAGAGVVREVGDDPIYGKYVIVDHSDGYATRYAHASTTLADEGRSVRRNEVIALTGSTGRSTAPHLHFEIFKDGRPVDPLTMVRQPS